MSGKRHSVSQHRKERKCPEFAPTVLTVSGWGQETGLLLEEQDASCRNHSSKNQEGASKMRKGHWEWPFEKATWRKTKGLWENASTCVNPTPKVSTMGSLCKGRQGLLPKREVTSNVCLVATVPVGQSQKWEECAMNQAHWVPTHLSADCTEHPRVTAPSRLPSQPHASSSSQKL